MVEGRASATLVGLLTTSPSLRERFRDFWSFEYVQGVSRAVCVRKQGKPCGFPKDEVPPFPRGRRGHRGSFDSDSAVGIYLHLSYGVKDGRGGANARNQICGPGLVGPRRWPALREFEALFS